MSSSFKNNASHPLASKAVKLTPGIL